MAISPPWEDSESYISEGDVAIYFANENRKKEVNKKMAVVKEPLSVDKEREFIKKLLEYRTIYENQFKHEYNDTAPTEYNNTAPTANEASRIASSHQYTVEYFDKNDDFGSFPNLDDWIDDNWNKYKNEIRYLIATTFCRNLAAKAKLFNYYNPSLESTLEEGPRKKKAPLKTDPEKKSGNGLGWSSTKEMEKETSIMNKLKSIVEDNMDVAKETAATLAKADVGQIAVDNLKKIILSQVKLDEPLNTLLKKNPIVDILVAQILAVALCIPEFKHDSKIKKSTDLLADCLVVFSTAKIFNIADIPGLFDKVTKGIDFSKIAKLATSNKEED